MKASHPRSERHEQSGRRDCPSRALSLNVSVDSAAQHQGLWSLAFKQLGFFSRVFEPIRRFLVVRFDLGFELRIEATIAKTLASNDVGRHSRGSSTKGMALLNPIPVFTPEAEVVERPFQPDTAVDPDYPTRSHSTASKNSALAAREWL